MKNFWDYYILLLLKILNINSIKLIIKNSIFDSNEAFVDFSYGGAIENTNKLILTNSIFKKNLRILYC